MPNSAQLKNFLNSTFASAGGSLSFERFMELALYDPDFGYYTSNITDVGGTRADFSTWATLADLASPVANWISEEITYHKWSGLVSLIEVGAGDGSLAQSILKDFGWLGRRKVKYHIVELSDPLRELQSSRLKGKGIAWHGSINDALIACRGEAIIFSNELVDAFPALWLRWNGKAWEEIFVSYSPDRGLSEEFRPCDLVPVLKDPPRGQRVEIHDSYGRWLDSLVPDFKQGSILTIDYGGLTLEEIYSRRPKGTMRGYFRQKRIEGSGVYQRFGKQDLTSDVDFSRLVSQGDANDLDTVRLEDQLCFMARYGRAEEKRAEAARAFYVLHQRKRGNPSIH